MVDPFVKEICRYLADNSTSFTFGSSDANLLVGELERGKQGVFAKITPSPSPDTYTPIQYYQIDFWAVYKSAKDAFEYMRTIYNFFHQAIDYQTDSYEIYVSHAISQPADLDRDGEGRKLLKLSVLFIVRNLIS